MKWRTVYLVEPRVLHVRNGYSNNNIAIFYIPFTNTQSVKKYFRGLYFIQEYFDFLIVQTPLTTITHTKRERKQSIMN